MKKQERKRALAALVGVLAMGAVGCDDDGSSPSRADVDQVSLGTVPIELDAGDLPQPPFTPDPQMQLVLNQIAAANVLPLYTLTPAQAREQPTFAEAVQAAQAALGRAPAVEPVGRIAHRRIPGPGTGSGGDSILVRVYTPAGTGPFPVIVYYHGGGWVIASLNTYDASARALTNAARAVVVSVAYRQAPTHKFPAAHDDAFAAYRFALDSGAAAFGGIAGKVAVVGESAGGNLAAAVTLMARDRGVRQPSYQVLVYPIADFNFNTESYEQNANAVPLNKRLMQWFFDKYLRSRADGQNPYVSPLRAPNVAGLAPATIINAQIDPLRSEGEAYAAKLRAAGVAVDQTTYTGVTHEFFGMGAVVDKARQAQAAAGLRRGFAQ